MKQLLPRLQENYHNDERVTQQIFNEIDQLANSETLEEDHLRFILNNITFDETNYLFNRAFEQKFKYYQNRVFVRGLIEISNYCSKVCKYCGINACNNQAERYRLTSDEIISCCKKGYINGIRTFVLQGGEDPYFTDDRLVDIIKRIKTTFPLARITLSLGERSKESYKRLKKAGVDRYLLRHEAASKRLYEELHPNTMSLENRLQCLYDLHELGYQTGGGFMVGSPTQTNEDIIKDLLFLHDLKPEMIGIGPFVHHKDTVYKEEPSGTLQDTLVMLALTRLVVPKAMIPATTALGTIAKEGREWGLLAGANVMMPNLSPMEKRSKYDLYEDKLSSSEPLKNHLKTLSENVKRYDHTLDFGVGDYVDLEHTTDFINKQYINTVLNEVKHPTMEEIENVLQKATERKRLNHKEIAMLLNAYDDNQVNRIYEIAGQIKDEIYGSRVVMFAPLYISNYCVNNCRYCGYRRDNEFERKKLLQEEIKQQAINLEHLGHKRLALEVGESPKETPIDYVLESIKTIYDNSSIRRINVNIAATSVNDYKKLHEVGIGTYILFQETYDKDIYKYMHPRSLKGDYNYHLHAFDRAFKAGIDDVGGGVLFGLADWKFEVLSLILHNEYLEQEYGVGFHTISVPRLKQAEGMRLKDFPHIISDEEFKRLVTVIRLAVPYVGIILSTRESKEMREELIKHGVSQVSAGSKTDVGGYHEEHEEMDHDQFELADERSVLEINKALIMDGFIPSYCTACYRKGRTGDRFMELAKKGTIGLICEPNALMTLTEYVMDYGDEELMSNGLQFIFSHAETIRNQTVKKKLKNNIYRIIKGERDLFF